MNTTFRPVDFDPFAGGARALPLTAQQREVWVEAQMGDDANCALNQCFVLTLDGPLSPASIENALNTVIARHAALRARFPDDGGEQVIEPAARLALTVHDHGALSPSDRTAALRSLVDTETATPFDLTHAPLLRAHLVRETDARHHLIVTAHHIVVDGWASAILFADLCAAYRADLFGLAADLPESADYAAAIKAQRQAAEAATDLDHWKALFADPVRATELPLDHARPELPSRACAREIREIDADLYARIKQLGIENRATLFQTLLAAFEVLVARLSGNDDLVTGIPTAGQADLPNPDVVGHFVVLLPLRSRLAGNDTFRDRLAATTQALRAAQSHATLSMSDLLANIEIEDGNGIGALMPVTFNVDRIGAPFEFAGARLVSIETPRSTSSFEHVVNVVDTGRTMTIQWDFWTGLYEAETIHRWLGHFETLLREIVRDPDQRIDQIDLLTPEDRHRMLVEWNRPEAPIAGPVPFLEAIDTKMREHPDRIAVVAGDGELTYAELDARVNRLAHHLISRGVGKGDYVGILLERTSHVPVSFLAVLKAGAAYVPIDPEYPEERIALMIRNAAIGVVVTEQDFAGLGPEGVGTIVVDAEDDAARIAAAPATPPPVSISADDIAHVHHTSGSTGEPKGIPVTHANLANVLYAMSEVPGVTPADVVCAVAPITFDVISQEIYIPLIVGARVVFADSDTLRDGQALAELIDRTGATLMQATPTRWRMLIDDGWQGRAGLKAQTGGEALTRGLADEILTRVGELWNIYGLTETTVWSTADRILQASDVPTIGRPLANTQVYVVNQAGLPQPVGVAGELLIGGLGLGTGYLNRPDLTAERFVPDTFRPETKRQLYRTGDLAKWLPDGRLVHLGRMDSQVKVNGVRIELGEVEAALRAHDAVRACAVIARELQPGDNRLLAYVIVEEGSDLTVSDFRRFLRKRLPDTMLPSFFITVDALPMTSSGKLDRKALPDPFETDAAAETENEPPAPGLETSLALIWKDVLRVGEINANDNFFDVGGSSMLALAVVRKFEQESGWRMDPRTLFYQSLRQIAGRAEEVLADGTARAGAS